VRGTGTRGGGHAKSGVHRLCTGALCLGLSVARGQAQPPAVATPRPPSAAAIYRFDRAVKTDSPAHDVLIEEAADGRLSITDGTVAMVNGQLTLDTAGATNLRVRVNKEIGYTTVAGLRISSNAVIGILQDGTVVVDREGVRATDDDGNGYVSRRVTLRGRMVTVMVKVSSSPRRVSNPVRLPSGEFAIIRCDGIKGSQVHLHIITVASDTGVRSARAEILRGASFWSVAQKYSLHPSKSTGGDLGVLSISDLSEAVVSAITLLACPRSPR
jgi:hypothetical protein